MIKFIFSLVILILSSSSLLFSSPPVEIIYFDVKTFTDLNVVEWATASELNSKEFVVERKALSLDTGYIEIGSVPAAGMSSSQKEYIIRDSLFNPMYDNVYRLKMVDLDGSFTYSVERQIGPAFAIDLSSFELNYNSERMEISWVTTNERMVDHFELKRKVFNHINNTRNWSKDIESRGDIAAKTDYMHLDSNIFEGDSIEYALYVSPKTSSNDSFLIARTITVKINTLEDWDRKGLRISPNPASDYIEINNDILSEAKFRENGEAYPVVLVYNVLGVEVLKDTTPSLRDTPPYQGGGIVFIDVSSLSPGVYFVKIGEKVLKFIKI